MAGKKSIGKGKGKTKVVEEPEKNKGKGKAKAEEPAKGKGKKKVEEVKETAPVADEKGKGKGKGKGKKETSAPETGGKRGRPKGVKYEVDKKKEDTLMGKYDNFSAEYDAVSGELNTLLESGTKSAIPRARKHLMNLIRLAKDLRFELQDTKTSMRQIPAK